MQAAGKASDLRETSRMNFSPISASPSISLSEEQENDIRNSIWNNRKHMHGSVSVVTFEEILKDHESSKNNSYFLLREIPYLRKQKLFNTLSTARMKLEKFENPLFDPNQQNSHFQVLVS